LSLVLCYHAVSPDWTAPLAVTPDALGEQLELLHSRGYRGVTFGELVRGNGAGKTVAVTFDDAYRSVFELARPILDRVGFRGSIYAVTGQIGREDPMSWPGIDRWVGTSHERELVPMSWQQLGELRADGWEVGSHTYSHPRLTTIPDDELQTELARSRSMLEQELGEPCTTIAYPYGDLDERVMHATATAGYEAAGALPIRLGPRDSLAWPRIGIYHADTPSRFRLKVSPTIRRVRATAAWPLISRALRRPGRSAPTT
jgi:peptidoglycan/xylan/chitin deacetylase (PgdA/CDA1 family)